MPTPDILLDDERPGPPGAALSSSLRQALGAGALHVDYEPEVDRHGTLRGLEARLRWGDSTSGAIDVASLLAVVDSRDVLTRLSTYFIEQVVRQCEAWSTCSGVVPVALDISCFLRGDDATDGTLWELLRRHRIPGERIQLGMAEASLGHNLDPAGRHLAVLRDRGLRVALDSFDTSSSSLDWMTALPVDTLKLNASFVHRLVEDRRCQAMVSAVTRLACALGLDVVAENIERRDQLDLLASLNVTAFQGPFFHGCAAGEFWTTVLNRADLGIAGWEVTAPAPGDGV